MSRLPVSRSSKGESSGASPSHVLQYPAWRKFEEASQEFFQKEPAALGTEEAALIAGLLRAPDYFSPRRHPELALQRRNKVLEEMVAQGKLGAEETRRLEATPVITP